MLEEESMMVTCRRWLFLSRGFRSYKVFFPYFGDLLDARLLELVCRGCLGKCGPAEVEYA